LLIITKGMAQPLVLTWQKLAEGGGLSSSQSYQITSTIGQADASSAMTNSLYSLTGGFWVHLDGPTILAVIPNPSNLLCCPGSSPTLTVVPSGTPPLSFQWRRNGANLMDSPSISGSTTSNLTLLAIIPEGAGSFDVIVKNAYGGVTSAPINLVVTSKPSLAVPIVSNGSIVGATLLDGGCGYTDAPVISFTGNGGTGALAYAEIFNGAVTNIQIVSGGSGYPANTLLTMEPPVYPTLGITLGPSNAFSLNAIDLMAGQTYQLEAANDLFSWAGLGTFVAPNTTWGATNVWSTSATNTLFFRLKMFH